MLRVQIAVKTRPLHWIRLDGISGGGERQQKQRKIRHLERRRGDVLVGWESQSTHACIQPRLSPKWATPPTSWVRKTCRTNAWVTDTSDSIMRAAVEGGNETCKIRGPPTPKSYGPRVRAQKADENAWDYKLLIWFIVTYLHSVREKRLGIPIPSIVFTRLSVYVDKNSDHILGWTESETEVAELENF